MTSIAFKWPNDLCKEIGIFINSENAFFLQNDDVSVTSYCSHVIYFSFYQVVSGRSVYRQSFMPIG